MGICAPLEVLLKSVTLKRLEWKAISSGFREACDFAIYCPVFSRLIQIKVL